MDKSQIEIVVEALEKQGFVIGDVLVPEECAQVYVDGKWMHLTLTPME